MAAAEKVRIEAREVFEQNCAEDLNHVAVLGLSAESGKQAMKGVVVKLLGDTEHVEHITFRRIVKLVVLFECIVVERAQPNMKIGQAQSRMVSHLASEKAG